MVRLLGPCCKEGGPEGVTRPPGEKLRFAAEGHRGAGTIAYRIDPEPIKRRAGRQDQRARYTSEVCRGEAAAPARWRQERVRHVAGLLHTVTGARSPRRRSGSPENAHDKGSNQRQVPDPADYPILKQ